MTIEPVELKPYPTSSSTDDSIDTDDDDDQAALLASRSLGPDSLADSPAQSTHTCCSPLQRLIGPTAHHELCEMFPIAWPVVVTFLLQMLYFSIIVIFIGHTENTVTLDAVGLGTSFANIFGISVCQGLSSAIDTLAAQAYGSPYKRQVGLVVQRGVLIVSVVALPLLSLYFNAEQMLLGMRQDPETSRLVGRFLKMASPYLPLVLGYSIMQRYLNAIGVVRPTMIVMLCANVFNAIMCFIFIGHLRMGLDGAVLVLVMTSGFMCGGLFLYIWRSGIYKETWGGWSLECLYSWASFVKLGIPGMVMLCVEWWSFEIAQFLAGLMGDVELATQLVMMQVTAFAFMIPLGISIASSVRVGNALGANKPHQARIAARVALAAIFVLALTVGILALILRHQIPYLFTSSRKVAESAAEVLKLVAIFMMFDHSQGVMSGILRGCGRQTIGAVVNVMGYYVVAAPIIAIMVLVKDYKVQGVWYGLLAGVAFQCLVIGSVILFKLDWTKEAEKAKARIESSDEEMKSNGQPNGHAKGEGGGMAKRQSAKSVGDDDPEAGWADAAAAALKSNDRGDHGDDHENDSDDDPLLEDSTEDAASGTAPRPMAPRSRPLRLRDLPKRILVRRGLALGVSVALLIVGVAVELSTRPAAICYPLPDVPHSEEICHGFSSLLAGQDCGVRCEQGYNATGRFVCGEQGVLLSNATCVGPS